MISVDSTTFLELMMQYVSSMVAVLLLVNMFGCSGIKLIEQVSSEGQERFTIKKQSTTTDTIYHGLYSMWYPNSIKKMEVSYKNGKKEGVETLWDPFGTKIRETWYKNGKKDGDESYWDVRGNLKKRMHYQNGLQNGVETTFLPDGKKIKEELYKSGIKNGIEKGYDEKERLIYQVLYKNGKKHGEESFYDYSAGVDPVITRIKWEDGEVVK